MKFFTCALLSAIAVGNIHRDPLSMNPHRHLLEASRGPKHEVPAQYWDSKINHFDNTDDRTYKQRYWVDDKFFDQDNGPVFLYICGEWTCSAPNEADYPMMVGA